MCFNAVDRHVEAGLGDKVAFHWAGNDPKDNKDITFNQLKVIGSEWMGVGLGDKVAFHWAGNDPKDNKDIIFNQLKVMGTQ